MLGKTGAKRGIGLASVNVIRLKSLVMAASRFVESGATMGMIGMKFESCHRKYVIIMLNSV